MFASIGINFFWGRLGAGFFIVSFFIFCISSFFRILLGFVSFGLRGKVSEFYVLNFVGCEFLRVVKEKFFR